MKLLILAFLLAFIPISVTADENTNSDSVNRVKRSIFDGRFWGAPKNRFAFMPVSIWGRKKRSIDVPTSSSHTEVTRPKRRIHTFYGGNGQPFGALTLWGAPYNPNTIMPVTSWGRKKRETFPDANSKVTVDHSSLGVREKRRVYNFYDSSGQPFGAFTAWGAPYNPNAYLAVTSWGRK